MNNIYNNRNFLEFLLNRKNKEQRSNAIIDANKSEIYALCEIMFNFLKGNITIEKEKIKKLKRISQFIRKVTKKNKTLRELKTIFVKKIDLAIVLIVPAVLNNLK